MPSPISLVIGLGNPGDSYEATRHNVGAWLVERFLQDQNKNLSLDSKLCALISKIDQPHALRIMRSTCYMNESGRSLNLVANYFKIKTEQILIVHDELDLPVGTVRLKLNGGHGGHNGLRDIFANFNKNNFARLRIGIGHPGTKEDVSQYVLSRPTKIEEEKINNSITRALLYLPKILSGDLEGAMQDLHQDNNT
jgi:PTH1 family peptidyl-tRNA hydrolase